MIYKNERNRNLTPSFAGKITSVKIIGSDTGGYVDFIMNIELQNGKRTFYYNAIPNNKEIIDVYLKDLCDTMLFQDTNAKDIKEASRLLKGTPVILLYSDGGYTNGGFLREISAGDNRYFSYERFVENRKKLQKKELKNNEVFNRPEF